MRTLATIVLAITIIGVGSVFAQEARSPSFPVSDLWRYGDILTPTLAEATSPTTVGRELGVVMSGNPHATMIGFDILRAGGNAFDAGVATAAAKNVTMLINAPWVGITPFIGFNAAEGVVAAYAGVGTAPAVATADYYRDQGLVHTRDARNPHETTLLPSNPDSYIAILQRWGTMSFTEVIQGALYLAEYGFPAPERHVQVAEGFDRELFLLEGDEYAAEWWQPGGRPPVYGEPVVNKDLANTFRILIDAEQAALAAGASRHDALEAVHDAFYKGEIAEKIAAWSEKNDGQITYDDLANYRGVWFEQDRIPSTTFMGIEVFGTPEWTQAGTIIIAMNILENFDLRALGWNTPAYINVISQSIELAMADKWQYFGDPDFVDIPEGLYSKEYGRIRAQLVNPNEANTIAPPPGDPVNMEAVLPAELHIPHPIHGAIYAGEVIGDFATVAQLDHVDNESTTWLGVIDKDGNIFSMTPSDGIRFPNAWVPEVGIAFGNRMWQFTVHDDNHSHVMMPGKRPMVTPNPVLGIVDGEGVFALGTPGSDQQPQSMLQTFLNYYLWDMSLQIAIDQPRFGTSTLFGAFAPFPYAPGVLRVENAFPEAVIQGLTELGYTVRPWGRGPISASSGSMGMVARDPATGLIRGGADSRRQSFVVGW